MRLKRVAVLLSVLAATAGFLGAGSASAASHQDNTDYYLSLGDSLSVGFEPDANGIGAPTTHGFDHDLLPALQLRDLLRGRAERLVELGCPGETTTSMIDGGVCTYPHATSQLDAATAFLVQHRGHVPYVTITIGATDVENCATATGIDPACVQQGLTAIGTNLPTILSRLQAADPGVGTRFVGLNEYDPFLSAFLAGAAGQQLAHQAAAAGDLLNNVLGTAYTAAGVRIADVASVFRSDDFADQTTLPGAGQVPVNVATICRFTFECAAAPVGPNIHPRDSGYRLMALAVLPQL